jgi:BNR repeat-containing family member
VARRTPAGTWSRGCLKASSGACATFRDDIGHSQPTLAVDGRGYIHVFASMHQDPWHHYRSSRPGDPTSMRDLSTTMPDGGHRITYPNATRVGNGDVYLIVRDSWDGVLYRWDNATRVWSRAAVFARDPEYMAYPDDVIAGADGIVHIAWEWAYGGSGGLRHLGSYVRYHPATGQFTNVAGAALTAPATHSSSTVYQPIEPGESATARSDDTNPPGLQTAKIALDPATGYPRAAYRFRPKAGGKFEVRLAEWGGAAWKRSTVYAGKYTTYAAVDVTIRSGAPRVYYAKTAVPSKDQAVVATRQANGRWVEGLLLAGVPVERLAAISRGGVDHVYLASPTRRVLHLETR